MQPTPSTTPCLHGTAPAQQCTFWRARILPAGSRMRRTNADTWSCCGTMAASHTHTLACTALQCGHIDAQCGQLPDDATHNLHTRTPAQPCTYTHTHMNTYKQPGISHPDRRRKQACPLLGLAEGACVYVSMCPVCASAYLCWG